MYDLVINNGILFDPARQLRLQGHLAIQDGRIAAIRNGELFEGKQQLDAAGHIVCPGFIDMHGHIDAAPYCAELSLRQGITTTVGGNCGASPLDLEQFFREQDETGFPLHQAEFIGHSTLRRTVGVEDPLQPATNEQILAMERLASQALEAGACGLSLGLAYVPGSSAEEVLRLSRLAARFGRLISIDTRLLSNNDLYSLVEAITIARQTGARMQISHLVYQYGTGMIKEALTVISKAIQDGLDIRFDSGMYTEWATHIGTVLFNEEALAREEWKLEDIIVITGPHHGQRLTPELYKHLRAEAPTTSVVVLTGIEEEIYQALLHPSAMPSTDTGAYAPGEGHPQIAGSFPRYFKKMVADRYDLSLMEAIRKATLLPADTLGLLQKGRLEEGRDADIVVFDIQSLSDNATFFTPDAPPSGIDYVIVNGRLALDHGVIQDNKAGRSIRCQCPAYDYQI